MEFFKIRRTIPFMRHALVFNIISLLTFLAAVFFLSTKGLNFSVEFTGGMLIEVSYKQAAPVEHIRDSLEKSGLKAEVQNFGSSRDVLIRIPVEKGQSSAELSQKVLGQLQAENKDVEMRRVEFVGPQIGKELTEYGAIALLVTGTAIVFYLWMRFVNWRFGLAALIANLHDVVIILGFFSFFQWEFSLSVLAGVLAVLGYSVNESVVVFDRVLHRGDRRQRHHRGDLAHHHHPPVHPDDRHHHAALRRRRPAQFRDRADHRHLLRNLFFGAGGEPAAGLAAREARVVRAESEARARQARGRGRLGKRGQSNLSFCRRRRRINCSDPFFISVSELNCCSRRSRCASRPPRALRCRLFPR
jgi:preprotein translocase subunit SecF